MPVSISAFSNFEEVKSSPSISTSNFNTVAFFTDDIGTDPAPYKVYTSIDVLANDYGTGSDTYQILAPMFSQSPSMFGGVAAGYLVVCAVPVDGSGNPIEGVAPLTRLQAAIENAPFFANFFFQTQPVEADIVAIASYNQSSQKRLYIQGFFTAADIQTGGTPSLIISLGYQYTRCLYYLSSDDILVNQFIAAYLGRMLTVQWVGGQVLTASLKTLIGILPDPSIDDASLPFLDSSGCDADISIEGLAGSSVYSSGGNYYWDNVYNQIVFKNSVDVGVFNVLKTTQFKVPATTQGQANIQAPIADACNDAVSNGYLAPGEWELDTLPSGVDEEIFRNAIRAYGFFIHQKLQTATQRKSRINGNIDLYVKEAGAIQKAFGSIYTDIA